MEQPALDDRGAGLGLRVLLVEDDTMLSVTPEDVPFIIGCT